MAGLRNKALEEGATVSEVIRSEALDRFKSSMKIVRTLAEPDTDAAAARGALEHQRIADVRGGPFCFGDRVQEFRSGEQRNVQTGRHFASSVFQSEGRIWAGVGPMKTIPASSQASANSGFSLRKP